MIQNPKSKIQNTWSGLVATAVAHPWTWVAGLTLLGLLLRRYHLGAESLWFDEADIVRRAQQPAPTLVRGFTEAGENGPLYTLLLHYWLAAIDALPAWKQLLHLAFGPNDEALARGLPALFGTAAIPLMYGLGRRAGGVLLGLVAAALLTVNPFHIWHSQDAKMYTLLVLLTLASSILYLDALQRNTLRLWAAYVLTTWIMLTVHSMSTLVLLAQLVVGLWALLMRNAEFGMQNKASDQTSSENTHTSTVARAPTLRNSAFRIPHSALWLRWSWAMLLILAPLFPIAWLRAAALFAGTDVGGWYTPTGLADILLTIFVKFAVNRADPPWEPIGALAMGLLALLGLIDFWRFRKRPGSENDIPEPITNNSQLATHNSKLITQNLVLALWLVPIVVFWLVTLQLPLFQPRYLIMALPPYLILAAAGLLAARAAHPALAAAGAILLALPTFWALGGVNYSQQVQKEDWRGAMSYVQDHLRLRDVIVVFPGYMVTAVNYYYRPGGSGAVPQVDIKTIPSLRTEGFGEVDLNARLRNVVTCHERAWLITSPPRQEQEDPENKVLQWFQYNYHTFDTRVYNGVTLYGISFNGQPNCWYPEPDHKERYRFENGLEFLGYIYELRRPDNTQPDASYLPLTLYWRNQQKVAADYLVRVSVHDSTGATVLAESLGTLNGYWPTSQWPPGIQVIDYRDLRLPGGLQPGDYRVSLQLYPQGHPDDPLKLDAGGTEIVFKDSLHVVQWRP
jgi:mannosyltransferase